MYSRHQASQLRQEFWTALGRYMSPVPSSEGEKINWINYKTGLRGVHFRMEANEREASVKLQIEPGSEEKATDYMNLLIKNRKTLLDPGAKWMWHTGVINDKGKLSSTIGTSLEYVSILNKEDWPALISFFKQNLVTLDAFWNSVKYLFDDLQVE